MATKKDYEAIAGVLRKWGEAPSGPTIFIPKDVLVSELATAFEGNNPNFDRDKFYKACYKKEE